MKGEYRYDFGDTAGHTPLMMMYTLGRESAMTPIMSDGLRYHAAAPIISALRSKGYVRVVFEESAHAVRAGIDEAKKVEAKGRRSASWSM